MSAEKRPIGFVQSATPSYAEARDLVVHEVKRFFKPELLNRLDDVIVFHCLEPEHVRCIARMFVEELVRRLARRRIEVEVAEPVLDKLAADGFDPVYGAAHCAARWSASSRTRWRCGSSPASAPGAVGCGCICRRDR